MNTFKISMNTGGGGHAAVAVPVLNNKKQIPRHRNEEKDTYS